MLLPLISGRNGITAKEVGICAQPDAVVIHLDHDHKPNQKIAKDLLDRKPSLDVGSGQCCS